MHVACWQISKQISILYYQSSCLNTIYFITTVIVFIDDVYCLNYWLGNATITIIIFKANDNMRIRLATSINNDNSQYTCVGSVQIVILFLQRSINYLNNGNKRGTYLLTILWPPINERSHDFQENLDLALLSVLQNPHFLLWTY